jgi:hypothetical protein
MMMMILVTTTTMMMMMILMMMCSMRMFVCVATPHSDSCVTQLTGVAQVDIENSRVQQKTLVDTDKFSDLTGFYWDSIHGQAYTVYQNELCSVDLDTGNVTFIATMWNDDQLKLDNLMSVLDEDNGLFIFSVLDELQTAYKVATYSLQGNFTLSPEVGRQGTVINVPQYVAFDRNNSLLFILAESRMGSEVDSVVPTTGDWRSVIDYDDQELQNWDVFPANNAYGSLVSFDSNTGNMYAVMIDDSSGDMQTTDLIRLDTKTKQVYVVATTSADLTNWVFVPTAA